MESSLSKTDQIQMHLDAIEALVNGQDSQVPEDTAADYMPGWVKKLLAEIVEDVVVPLETKLENTEQYIDGKIQSVVSTAQEGIYNKVGHSTGELTGALKTMREFANWPVELMSEANGFFGSSKEKNPLTTMHANTQQVFQVMDSLADFDVVKDAVDHSVSAVSTLAESGLSFDKTTGAEIKVELESIRTGLSDVMSTLFEIIDSHAPAGISTKSLQPGLESELEKAAKLLSDIPDEIVSLIALIAQKDENGSRLSFATNSLNDISSTLSNVPDIKDAKSESEAMSTREIVGFATYIAGFMFDAFGAFFRWIQNTSPAEISFKGSAGAAIAVYGACGAGMSAVRISNLILGLFVAICETLKNACYSFRFMLF